MSSGDEFGKNVAMCRVDNSFTAHADNRKKYILILGKDPKDRLGDSTITAEAEYSILVKNKKSYLGFHYNGSNCFSFR